MGQQRTYHNKRITYSDNVLDITTDGEYKITMAYGSDTTETDHITVTATGGSDVIITLDDVNISSSSASPFEITSSTTGNVTIKLSGDNVLTSTADNCAGLQKTSTSNSLTITSADGDGETSGTLTATGGNNSAGIGGGYGGNGSYITISGGNVTATGGSCGIGGGSSGTAENIYISPNTSSEKTIKARYSTDGRYTFYNEKTDITSAASAASYFESCEIDTGYTLAAEIAGLYKDNTIESSVTENFNANDEIAVNINASYTGTSNVGSLQFALSGDWFTLESVTPVNSTGVCNAGTKSASMTGLAADVSDIAVALATVIIKVNSDVETTEGAEIGFASSGCYITPTGENDEIVPKSESASANIYNIKVTFESGDYAAFGTEDSTTAYVKYNEAGLYTDNTYAEAFTMPTPTAIDGYRLAAGTEAEPLWSDGTNTYADSTAVSETAFTADAALAVQTVAQYVVTINPIDASIGTLYYDFGGSGSDTSITETTYVTVDTGTTLDEFNFSFETAGDTAYYLKSFIIAYGDGTSSSVDNYIDDLEAISITQAAELTPVAQSSSFSLNFDYEGEPASAADLNGVEIETEEVSGVAYSYYYGSYGSNITFSLSTDSDVSVYSVYYTVDSGSPVLLTPSSGVYTIEGSKILGDIEITITSKKYYKITFQSGTGTAMTSVTGYAWDGLEGIYTSAPNNEDTLTKYTSSDITGGLSAESGYRLKDEDAGESLWNDGLNDYTTAYILNTLTFSEDKAFTAQSVKTYVVSFASGGNGSVGTAGITVDTGSSFDVPSVTPDSYYTFSCWDIGGTKYTDDQLAEYTVTADTTVTACFVPSTYSVTFASSDYGSFAPYSGVEGDSESGYTGTYLTDIVFTFDTSEIIENVYCSINGEEKALTQSSGYYTISGSDVIGEVSIYYNTAETAVFTFYVDEADSEKGSLTGTTAFVLSKDESLSESQINSIGVLSGTGYTFDHWEITAEGDVITSISLTSAPDEVTSGSAIEVIILESTMVGNTYTDSDLQSIAADRNLAFKAVFVLSDFNVTDENGAVDIIDGSLENGYAHMGTDIMFTIKDDFVVSYTAYKIGDAEEVKITADSETGVFTISGDIITDDVAIVTTVVMQTDSGSSYDPSDPSSSEGKAALDVVDHDVYVGESIAAADGRKIALINADKLDSGGYALTGYGDFFYSEAYGAYVIWIDDEETSVTIKGKLTTSENDPVVIEYSGDINGTGTVTAGDAGIINDILKNQWNYDATDKQLFMLDVEQTEGYQQILTSDVVWTLKESIGLNTAE